MFNDLSDLIFEYQRIPYVFLCTATGDISILFDARRSFPESQISLILVGNGNYSQACKQFDSTSIFSYLLILSFIKEVS